MSNTAEALATVNDRLGRLPAGAPPEVRRLLLAQQAFLVSQGDEFDPEDMPGPRARLTWAVGLLDGTVADVKAGIASVADKRDEWVELALSLERAGPNRVGALRALEADMQRRRT